LEHVVEHERRALGGREAFEHGEQRGAHGFVERHSIGRVRGHAARRGRARCELERRILGRCFAPRARRAEVVEAEASDDDDEPTAHVLDAVEVLPGEAHEGLLHHVLGSTEVAEHAEGDIEKMAMLALCDLTDAGIERAGGHGDPLVSVLRTRMYFREDDVALRNVTGMRSAGVGGRRVTFASPISSSAC
jgi:hypothetical protein